MLNKSIISKMMSIIDDKLNNKCDLYQIKKRTISIFRNKKISTILSELNDYKNILSDESKKDFPKDVLIIVWALIRRNLDCIEELTNELIKSNLIKALYEGLNIIFQGKSEHIKIQIKWTDDHYANRYEFLNTFPEFYYFEFIELLLCGKITYYYDKEKFETFIINDPTKLFLLNIYSGHLGIKLSDNLIKKLLDDEDKLKNNMGFGLLMRPINRIIQKYESSQRCVLIGEKYSERQMNKDMAEPLQKLGNMLNFCRDKVLVDIIMNYILQFDMFPKAFAQWLSEAKYKPYILKELQSSKIRSPKELNRAVFFISKLHVDRVLRRDYYNTILMKIENMIQERQFYIIGNDEFQLSKLCKKLPRFIKNKLITFIGLEKQKLLTTNLDKMTRYEIFLQDIRQEEMLNIILNIILNSMQMYNKKSSSASE